MAPTLAPHGVNVRCKKTYRAAQRTHRVEHAFFSINYFLLTQKKEKEKKRMNQRRELFVHGFNMN
jgi:hypothetical protein